MSDLPLSLPVSQPSVAHELGPVGNVEWLPPHEAQHLGLREYCNTLKRHHKLILGLFLGCLITASLVVSMITRQYTARSTVLIEPRQPQALSLKDLATDSQDVSADDYYYETQYQILKSRTLAAQVIHELKLSDKEPFKSWGRRQRMSDRVREALGHLLKRPSAAPRWLAESLIVDKYLNALEVKPEQRSGIVSISFSSPSPELSALVVNAHVAAYIQRAFEIHRAMSQDAELFLSKKLSELKVRLRSSETALNSFRRKRGDANSSPDGSGRLLVQRFTELNNELNHVENDRIRLEAQNDVIQRDSGTSVPFVLDNPTVQRLTDKMDVLSAQFAEMSNRFSTDYHPLADLGAKLTAIKKRRAEAIAGVMESTKAEYMIDTARERQLEHERDVVRAQILALNDASLQDAVLQREVDINNQLYKSVLERLNEIEVAAEVPVTNISVVDVAKPPVAASSPKVALVVGVSGFLGLFGALGLSFLLDHLDDSFEGPADVERYLRLPTMGVVPDFKQLHGKRYSDGKALAGAGSSVYLQGNREILVTADGHSLAGEIYRGIRTALLYSCPDTPPKSVLVASAAPGEGKTVSSINVGLAFAQMGARTLLVDADLRSSRCHEVLGLSNERGLSEVLTGQSQPHEVIQATKAPQLYIMTAGSTPTNPGALLGSSKMRELLSKFCREFDHIVIDSPPTLAVNDAVMLSTMVDGVLLIVGPSISKTLVRELCSRLAHVRARILGVIMNGAEMPVGAFPSS
jgi:succinoglycan biosynthesis transport protein ExoP